MKQILIAAAVAASALPFAGSAQALDVEALCHEKINRDEVPPEVTDEQINAFCSCLSTEVNANADLLAEVTAKADNDEDEEMSEAFNAAQKTCQEQALAE